MKYVDFVYEILKTDSQGLDAVYEDYILQLVGEEGFKALLQNNLLEACGAVSGRQLWAIVEKRMTREDILMLKKIQKEARKKIMAEHEQYEIEMNDLWKAYIDSGDPDILHLYKRKIQWLNSLGLHMIMHQDLHTMVGAR